MQREYLMIWKILGYEFEVDEDGSEYPEKVDSLESALIKMSSDGFLIAKYDAQIDDRTLIGQVETLSYEDITQLSEQQILELIERRIKIKHNL